MGILFDYVRKSLNNSPPSLTALSLAENLILIDQYANQLDKTISKILQTSLDPYTQLIGRLITPSITPDNNLYISIQDDCLKAHASLIK